MILLEKEKARNVSKHRKCPQSENLEKIKLDSSKTLKSVPQTNWKADFPDQMLVFF